MRINSKPTRCSLFFDLSLDDDKIKVELDQNITSGEITVKAFKDNGEEIEDSKLLALVSSFIIQKYKITYDDSEEASVTETEGTFPEWREEISDINQDTEEI